MSAESSTNPTPASTSVHSNSQLDMASSDPISTLKRVARHLGSSSVSNETDIAQQTHQVPTRSRQVPARDEARSLSGAGIKVISALEAPRRLVNRSLQRVSGLQTWQGRVLDIDAEIFSAEIVPIDHDGPTLVADFQVSKLAPQDDSGELHIGDVFYLTVRTIKDKGNLPSTTSSLRMKRVGHWTEQELESARSEANLLLDEIMKYAERPPRT